jgi:DNA-binding transcriptional LysR family regulator
LENEYVALMPPQFRLAADHLTWADLAQQPRIMPPVDRVMMQDVYAQIQAHGHPLNVVSEVETDTPIVNLVAQGMGATIARTLKFS